MKFEEYKTQIDKWHQFISEHGITNDDDDKPLPLTFWKTFLGITRKQHQDMYRGTFKNKSGEVPTYLCRSIEFANKLSKREFLALVRYRIPEFNKNRAS